MLKHIYILAFGGLFSIATFAQENSTETPDVQLRKFRLDIGLTSIRFVGPTDPLTQGSKSGFGAYLQPSYNLTNAHSVGLKMLLSYHFEDPHLTNWSLMGNYSYALLGKSCQNSIKRKCITGFAGASVGITGGPGEMSNPEQDIYVEQKSLALMPFIGLRYSHIYLEGLYHLAANNKYNTFFGFTFGVMIGGGYQHNR